MNPTFEDLPKMMLKIFQQNEEILEQIKKINPQKIEDTWFTIRELCNYLPDKPATATVYGWVHTAQIPCHKGNKKLRFLKSEIDIWLLQGRKK